MAIQLLTLEDLSGHDVYEVAYAHAYPGGHWSPQSLYLTDNQDGTGVDALVPALNQVFPDFAYYGPQKVFLEEWKQVERLYLAKHPEETAFFLQVRAWLDRGNRGAGFFWFLGV